MKRGETPEPQRSRLLAAATQADSATEDLRDAVREAKDAGGSVREIAALINRSTNTVQRWLRG
ncbi:helix-turn-helix domain-containing protein [Mycobacteroides abscessus]|uniref:helix-turn-helix domain-containing protein n=1 Tax=Mycobacteroides abscessus TaxID=36809 RepID=UPI0009419A23